MNTLIRPVVVLLALFTLLLGLVYPAVVTAVAQVAFAHAAGGSLVMRGGGVVGSSLIGQNFTAPKYFWGRLSATTPQPYNGLASGGSNYGPLNPALTDAAKARIQALRAADPGNTRPVPVDLVTASGSGLDPDISIAAALYQVRRVAAARGLSTAAVRELVNRRGHGRLSGLLGEPRVNVLELNLAMDDLTRQSGHP